MTWRNRGYGYLQDPSSAPRRMFRPASPRQVAGLPEKATLAEYLPDVFDQGSTGTCGPHAKIGALLTAGRAQGLPLPFVPSPSDLYRLTLSLDRKRDAWGRLPPLQDTGSEPLKLEQAVKGWGITPIGELAPDGRYSDCTPESILVEPDLDLVERSACYLLAGDYAIDTVGDTLLQDVKFALATDHPVTVGFWADTAFARFQPSSPPLESQDLSDPDGGWHYVYLYGYDGDTLLGRNSWGIEWGDLGNFRAGPAWLRRCVGLYAHRIVEVGR